MVLRDSQRSKCYQNLNATFSNAICTEKKKKKKNKKKQFDIKGYVITINIYFIHLLSVN